MVVLENAVAIARSPAEVFDYLSDLSNEQEWNPKLRAVERLTGEPLGVGSRFRAQWAGSPTNVVEYTRFDRPSTWATVATSRMLTVHFSARVAAAPMGAQLVVRMELVPHGPLRLAQPLLRRWMQGQEANNMRFIKHQLESLPAR